MQSAELLLLKGSLFPSIYKNHHSINCTLTTPQLQTTPKAIKCYER